VEKREKDAKDFAPGNWFPSDLAAKWGGDTRLGEKEK